MPERSARRAVPPATGAGFLAALVLAFLPTAAGAAPPDRSVGKIAATSIAAPAPADAAKDPVLRLTDVACPATGDCTAVGTYRAANGAHRGVIEHLVHGKWHAQAAPEPIFADTDPMVTLSVITCASIHFCVAFGTYVDATDAPQKQGLLETYERETPADPLTWSGSRLFATPGGAAVAEITAASCSSDRTCAAVGSYVSSRGVRHAQLETYHESGWVPSNAALPADAKGSSSLAAVDCISGSLCSAAGTYTTTTGARGGLFERLSSSAWSDEPAALPPSAGTDPGLRLNAIACPGVDGCVAGGEYVTAGGHRRGLIETRAFGIWSPTTAPVPTGGATDPKMSLTSVSCSAAGDCAATSALAGTHGHQLGALLRRTGDEWHAARPKLTSAAADPEVALTDLACGQVAVGSFTDASGHTRPLLQTLGGQGWTGRTGPLPTGASRAAAALAAVACDPGGTAFAVGRYVDGSGRHRGLITRTGPA